MAYQHIKPYSDMVHTAKTHGGAEPYINDIKADSYKEGYRAGQLTGAMKLIRNIALCFGMYQMIHNKNDQSTQ